MPASPAPLGTRRTDRTCRQEAAGALAEVQHSWHFHHHDFEIVLKLLASLMLVFCNQALERLRLPAGYLLSGRISKC